MSEATPRPWRLSTDEIDLQPGFGWAILGTDDRALGEEIEMALVPMPDLPDDALGDQIGASYRDMNEANAKLIVRAVNSFDDLVEALHTAIKTIKLWHEMTPPSDEPEALNGWDEYLAGSPEMREIMAALEKAQS